MKNLAYLVRSIPPYALFFTVFVGTVGIALWKALQLLEKVS